MNDVSIILPLFDRPEHTERILGYYNLYKVNYTFIIADGSKKKIFTQKKLKEKFPFVKIVYRKFPVDKTCNFYTRKMLKINKFIKTKYVYQIANDDFFNPKFIEDAKNFLDRNKSYVFVGGVVRNVRIIQFFKPVNDFGLMKFQKKNQYYNYKNVYRDINNPKLKNRILLFLSSLPYETVIRSNTYHEIWKLIEEFKIHNTHEIDWFFNMIPLIRGKKKFLKIVSTIRQSNTFSGLGLENISRSGASKERFNQYLNFLVKKRVIKSKIIVEQLKNTENYKLSIEENKESLSRYIVIKKKYFKYYSSLKNFIFKLNYFFTFFFFMFYKNKYSSLYSKINQNFKSRKKFYL